MSPADNNVLPEEMPISNGKTPLRKNLTFAVNYELALVDQFLSVADHRGLRALVETPTTNSTLATVGETPMMASSSITGTNHQGEERASDLENDIPNLLQGIRNDPRTVFGGQLSQQEQPQQHRSQNFLDQNSMMLRSPPALPSDESSYSRRRISTRDKQKSKAPLARTRVRYDMQLVPHVKRNQAFLNRFVAWWLSRESPTTESIVSDKPNQRSSRVSGTSIETSDTENKESLCLACERCDDSSIAPFAQDTSVIWIPSKRSEWEDTVSEMTAVCTSAAIRRFHRQDDEQQRRRPFYPPLSRDYIRDRIDIDDPLYGYQIRHKEGGWLQGFVLFTNFTTWTYGFHWDSKHPMSGMSALEEATETINNSQKIDVDGTLAGELEAMPRSGDPGVGGIVFSCIAEIALLGGLGCGEYLLRMALNDILAQPHYKYVVLQATVQSRTFYERFGFIRVGAICYYCQTGKPATEELQQQPELREPSVVGYRHWTHANESERSLQKHGGPSYMMCLKLPERDSGTELELKINDCELRGYPSETNASFVDQMLMALRVESKPRVEQLGATSTQGPKSARRSNSMPIEVSDSFESAANSSPRGVSSKKKTFKKGPIAKQEKRRIGSLSSVSSSSANATIATYMPVSKPTSTSATKSYGLAAAATNRSVKVSKIPKRSLSINDLRDTEEPSRKIQRLAEVKALPKGTPTSYVEKQYHSIWLAVPPAADTSYSRPPPKPRVGFSDDPSSSKKYAASILSSNTEESKNFLKPIDRTVPRVTRNTASPRSTTTQPHPKKSVLRSSVSIEKGRLSTLSNTVSKTELGRVYHSVRGNDGKFVRVAIDDPTQPQPIAKEASPGARLTSAAKKGDSPSSSKKNIFVEPVDDVSPDRPAIIASIESGKPVLIDTKIFRKQKVNAYPRNRVHYYNRVVKPKCGEKTLDEFFFVVEYDEAKDLLCIVPMIATGKLAGRREGRPRYQCVIRDTVANFQIVAAADYVIVRSAMVMKTPVLALEAWDIDYSNDADFSTK